MCVYNTLLPRYVRFVPDSARVAHEFHVHVRHLLRLGVRVYTGPSWTVILHLRRRLATAVYGCVRRGTLPREKERKEKEKNLIRKYDFIDFFLKKRSFVYYYLRTLGEFDMGRSTRAARDSLRLLLHRCWLVYRRNRSVLATRKKSHASLQTAFSRRFVFRVQADACVFFVCVCVYVYVCIVRWFVQDGVYAVRKHWKCGTYKSEGGEKKMKGQGKGIHRLRKYRQKMNMCERERERDTNISS